MHSANLALPKKNKKYFTVEEANRSLVYVKMVASEVVETYANIVTLRRYIEESKSASQKFEGDYDEAMNKLSDLIDELHPNDGRKPLPPKAAAKQPLG
ncbi:MAG: DUF2203 family protein, partial [Candidatus Competibacteraceae bacterium]|nr:DUF2203 family protein [Candidatus Competibacteraceae bacterium]